MTLAQPAILAPLTPHARWMFFDLVPGGDARAALLALAGTPHTGGLVSALGRPAVAVLGADVPGLETFPALSHRDVSVPSTQAALACWVRGEDRGEILHRGRALAGSIARGFRLREQVDTFVFADSRDLTGYEDGTESPKGDAATKAAIAVGKLAGSSFVAVQRWVHDLDRFQSFPSAEQDAIFGRRRSDNTEIDDAPASAHVKRATQESFEPPAFVVRRSTPWAGPDGEGLVFVAFGASFDAFDALLRRMVGLEDGVTDALFRFTRPVSGSYFWCPPCRSDGTLDLSLLGL